MASKLPQRLCVLDLETAKTRFKYPENSKLAFVGLIEYGLTKRCYLPRKHKVFYPYQLSELEQFLRAYKGIVIGHNIFNFDYRVLNPHFSSLRGIIEKTVDTLYILYRNNSNSLHGLGLNSLSQANLGKHKTLDGKSIAQLWNRGKKGQAKVIAYNENDCRLTYGIWFKLVTKKNIKVHEIRPWARDIIDKTIHPDKPSIQLAIGQHPSFTYKTWLRNIQSEQNHAFKKRDPIHHSKYKCIYCGSGKVSRLEEDFISLSEAELTDWNIGLWGTLYCYNCKKSWGFG